MALRGHIIEGATFIRRVDEVGAMPHFKDLRHGLKVLKYLMWTLNSHVSLASDNSFKGSGCWFYDKPYFQSKVDKFENSIL